MRALRAWRRAVPAEEGVDVRLIRELGGRRVKVRVVEDGAEDRFQDIAYVLGSALFKACAASTGMDGKRGRIKGRRGRAWTLTPREGRSEETNLVKSQARPVLHARLELSVGLGDMRVRLGLMLSQRRSEFLGVNGARVVRDEVDEPAADSEGHERALISARIFPQYASLRWSCASASRR